MLRRFSVNYAALTMVLNMGSLQRLLTEHEMRELFADAQIMSESFIGLKKSFIAVKADILAIEAVVSPRE